MKFTYEIAVRLRDEAFTEEEKVLLSSVQGAIYIDIADQLMTSYQNYKIRNPNLNGFIKDFAVLKAREGNYIIRQLELLNEKLDELMDPKKFYQKGDSFQSSNTNLINDFSSKNVSNDESGNFVYEFTEASNETKSGSLVRGANTQTSQQNKGLENKWKKDSLLNIGSPKLVGKKEFDPNKILTEKKVLDVREAHYEIIPEEQPEIEDIGGDLYSMLNVGLTGNVGNNYGATNRDNLSVSRTDGIMTSTSNTYSNTDYNVHKDYSSYIQNDATLKSIRLAIPNLQNKFFAIFSVLFELVI